MQYLQPFLYFVKKPKTGPTNVLIGCLGPLIPIVGEMVLLGYRAEVSEELERDPDLKDHPDLKLDKLMVYLQRGVGPWLARLVFAMIFVWPALALAVGAGFGAHELISEPLFGFAVGAFVFLLMMMVGMTILWPMEYHAQVTKTFSPIKELAFAYRFARVCWFSTFVAVLMFNMLSGVLNLIGLLLLYIGLYPAYVIQQMAEQHIMTQLYLLYLEEGGEPIELPESIKERRRDDVFEEEEDQPKKRARRVEPEQQ